MNDYNDNNDDNSNSNDITNTITIPKKFIPTPFQYHEIITITIDDITNLGSGVGRYLLPDGISSWVVMVPLCLPGEIVKARIYRNHQSYSDADLIEIIKPSSDRIIPLCKYFEICGGCQYQHITVSAQRLWKRQQVLSLLNRIGNITNITVNDVIGTDNYYGYRTKITPHYNAPRSVNDLKVGFQQRGTRIVIDIDQCIIAVPEINEKYESIRKELKNKMINKLPKKGATLLLRSCEEGVETDHTKIITQKVNGIEFKFKAGEFFQNNEFVIPLMVDHVIKHAIGDDCNYLIDAYCGSGLFSLCAASSFKRVEGVEVSDLAIKAAIKNAELNNITNANFICASSEAIFSKVQDLPRDNTIIILDPPRKGCDDDFLKQLIKFYPKKIVYVSCDPATQARDAKFIVDGGYRIKDVTPFDLFPQTRHIENVIVFIRD
jgi:23S rRNA (uracil1939-C5)-methyltransferase/tRNA (uracil-5-)-methyltransferase